MTRMGWTGRAPAPNGSQSVRGACQEKEHHHASHVHGSCSDRHRNGYGQVCIQEILPPEQAQLKAQRWIDNHLEPLHRWNSGTEAIN
jgi:hypothetical protein